MLEVEVVHYLMALHLVQVAQEVEVLVQMVKVLMELLILVVEEVVVKDNLIQMEEMVVLVL
jgi:hypothetical protein